MGAKNRICFVLGTMKRGGGQRVVSILANHYLAKGWAVDIVMLLSGDCEYEIPEDIGLVPIVGGKYLRGLRAPVWIFGLRRYFKKQQPDVVLSLFAKINIIAWFASRGFWHHLVVSERNDPLQDGRSRFVQVMTEAIYPRVHHVVFQTELARAYFSERVVSNSTVVYNPARVSARAKGIRSGKIVSVGKLWPQKNHHLLIRAFCQVVREFPQYKLYIFGEGGLRDSLAGLVSDLGLKSSVFLPGNIMEIHREMAEAEMFVLSSDYEGLSNALLEAMLMGLPCISTENLGAKELLVHGQNGLLVPVGSLEGLVCSMSRLIKDRELAKRLGENAANIAEQVSTDRVLGKWEEVLEAELRSA